MIADISPLVGRHFVSKAGNVCRIQRLDEGAIRVTWKTKPTDEDMAEFSDFAESVLGPLEPTLNLGIQNEVKNLAQWKRRLRS